MTSAQWKSFSTFRDAFRTQCDLWNKKYSKLLRPLQKAASVTDTPDYPLETAVVYNRALDDITENSDIHLIVIGDNPGKDEQLEKNNRYLVGQSGKIAEGFFRRNPELGTDFRKNVIILNKTPVHTAKTAHLKYLNKNGGNEIKLLILESQLWMAKKTAELHQSLCEESKCKSKNDGTSKENRSSNDMPFALPEIWLVGYGELKGKGMFLPYRDELAKSYNRKPDAVKDSALKKNLPDSQKTAAWKKVFVYQHFSMNRFSIDLSAYCSNHEKENLINALHELGAQHRKEIFNN